MKFYFAHRRQLWLTLAVVSFSLYLTGCTTSWVGEATSIVTQLVPAITGILSLLMAFGASKITLEDIALVQRVSDEANADLQKVKSLLDQYSAAAAADQPGILTAIETAVKTIITNYSTILPALHIKDPATIAKVEAIIGLVASELQALLNVIPAIQGKMALNDVTLPLNAKQFRAHFNRTLVSKTGDSTIDSLTPQFQLK